MTEEQENDFGNGVPYEKEEEKVAKKPFDAGEFSIALQKALKNHPNSQIKSYGMSMNAQIITIIFKGGADHLAVECKAEDTVAERVEKVLSLIPDEAGDSRQEDVQEQSATTGEQSAVGDSGRMGESDTESVSGGDEERADTVPNNVENGA